MLFNNLIKKINEKFSSSSKYIIIRYISRLIKNLPFIRIPWYHQNIPLNSLSSDIIEINEIQNFLNSLDKEKEYILLIAIICNQGMYMAPKSKIENIHYLSSAESLHIKINIEISTVIEQYSIESISHIVFRYREFINKPIRNIPSKFSKSSLPVSRDQKNSIFTDYLVPFSLSPNRYGKLIEDNGDIKTYLYNDKFKIEREFSPVKDSEIYKLKVYNKNNNDLLTEVIDEKITNNEFIRKINDFTLKIKSGVLTMFESTGKYKFIESMTPDHINESEMDNFITLDIEAYLDENSKFVPYAIGWYKSGQSHLYYSTDFETPNHMIIKAFDDLLVKENKNCVVYIHNNKKFDSIFIINALIHSDFKLKPIYKDDLALSITVIKNYGSRQSLRVVLKDSYLLFPSSLRNLSKDFEVDTLKGIFPHSFASEYTLNYKGLIPPFEAYPIDSFENIEEYNLLSKNTENWDFKKESLKYLLNDIKSLYEIIYSARKSIYKSENVDILKVLTNASLSFKIFKTKYFSKIPLDIVNKRFSYSLLEWKKIILHYTPKIAILNRNEYNFMSKAYYGGVTEVFIPFIKNGFYYDVNSFYPFVMKNLMPVGNPTYSNDPNLDNYFGVVRAEITTPDYLEYPVLPLKCDDGKNRFVLGSWTGTYSSEELKNARDNFYYDIKVIDGYKFDKNFIFVDFVEHFYNLKTKFSGTALGSIYKLILNSLYGRFGMNPIKTVTELVTQDKTEEIMSKHNVLNIRDLGNGMEMVTYESSPKYDLEKLDAEEYVVDKLKSEFSESFFDINVSISLFITSYARIHLFNLIKKYDIKVYYMDTDSIITDKALPDEEVSPTEIGKLKLEYKISKGIHPALKTYYHLTDNIKKPIVIKAKGAGKNLSFNDFYKLVRFENIVYPKEKWFIDKNNLTIQVKLVNLNIKGGTNKRRMIIFNDLWMTTKPLYFNEIPKLNKFVITQIDSLIKHQLLLTAPNYKLLPLPYNDSDMIDSKSINNSIIYHSETNKTNEMNVSLFSYNDSPKVVINFPPENELKRLFPRDSSYSRFIIVLNSDMSFFNSFKSINLASRKMNMSHHTIEKYINSGELYRNYFFFSNK